MYQVERKQQLPYDCTKCQHFKKPLLADPEGVRYYCFKNIYMPQWSILYCSNYLCLCQFFEPTPESGIIISPQEKAEVQAKHKDHDIKKYVYYASESYLAKDKIRKQKKYDKVKAEKAEKNAVREQLIKDGKAAERHIR